MYKFYNYTIETVNNNGVCYYNLSSFIKQHDNCNNDTLINFIKQFNNGVQTVNNDIYVTKNILYSFAMMIDNNIAKSILKSIKVKDKLKKYKTKLINITQTIHHFNDMKTTIENDLKVAQQKLSLAKQEFDIVKLNTTQFNEYNNTVSREITVMKKELEQLKLEKGLLANYQ